MRKFFWCLFVGRNYKISSNLNSLIYKCISLLENCSDISVEIEYYYITITTPSIVIEMWNANKFYAWLSSGSVNGYEYRGVGASAKALYDFKKCLKKHGYNIHVPKNDVYIPINDVKC